MASENLRPYGTQEAFVRHHLMNRSEKLPDPVAESLPSNQNCVRIRGAREHDLKSVSLDIPRNALVVFTGVSSSGKSSLAFGTLYAEAQRRYL